MNVTTATSAQNVSSSYNRQQKTSTESAATTATQGDTVTISDEAKAIEQGSQSLEAYRLPDWYADMLPLARTIDLSQQQIGAPYRETQAYAFSQFSQQDQQSINDYSGKLLTFFHDEVARLTDDGSANYVQIRDSEALQQAVMARFESDPSANALLERMQELGQITL